jgi:EmrB/QacA subfamily drug resistance transporter
LNLVEFFRGRAAIGARGVALIVASALFLINLDGSIMTTSLPQMARSFGVSSVDVSAGVAAYLLAVAAFIPLSGWIADRYGAKRVFAGAIVLFTLASIACGAASSLGEFILARVAQGLGGALMMPVGRMIVLRRAEKHEIMQATALITWPALIAPVLGPVLGGAITTYADWRWNFLLNAPLGIVGLLLVLAYVPDDREADRRPLDLLGGVLTSTALFLLIYALEQLARPAAGAAGAWTLIAALVTGLGAVSWLRRAKHPLIDLRPFGYGTFRATTLDAGALHRLAISATPFLLPLMLQDIWSLSPFQAGLVIFVYFGANLAMKTITTPLLRLAGFKRVLVVNGLIGAVCVGACGFLSASTPIALTCVVVFLAGASRSLQMTALNTLSFADLPGELRSSGATLSTMMQQLAMAVGIAAAALFLQLSQSLHGSLALSASDFRWAFVAVAACALVGTLLLFRMDRDAGWEVSGQARTAAGPV